MNRRGFLATVAGASAAVMGQSACAPSAAVSRLSIDYGNPGRPIPADFTGLSYESAVLASFGGFIGIITAYLAVYLVKATFSFPMETPFTAVILSLCLSTAVGLFFGIFPAMRAAKLDPIEALRYE